MSEPSVLARVPLPMQDSAGVPRRGEVVLAATAAPELLRLTGGGPDFRILLVGRLDAKGIAPAPGVAVCVPGGLTAVGEAVTPYETAGSLHLRREQVEAYRRGVVLLPGGVRRSGEEFFPREGTPDFQRLAALLLPGRQGGRPGPFLEALTGALGSRGGGTSGPAARLRSLLEGPAAGALPVQAQRRLRKLAQAPPDGLEPLSARLYGSPEALREAAAALALAAEDPDRYQELVRARAFLREGVPPLGVAELELDRRLLADQLSFAEVAGQPHRWPAMAAALESYGERYRRAYSEHHQKAQEAAHQLQDLLAETAPQVRALRLLNAIPQLGPPLGEEALRAWRALRRGVQPCSAVAPDLPGDAARCRLCGLDVTDRLPAAATHQAVAGIHRALREQLRRLAGSAVRRLLLARSKEPRLTRFLQVVQASDLASLAEVMDAPLARFLRDLLAEGDVVEVEAPVWQEVQRQFPHLDEEQTERAVEALRAALDRALEEARRRYPGRRIRLTWR